ncbi:MAG: hypothetical protein Q8L27_03320, partial [archaeon]|nr:hypothetical protein [archaeon]
MENKEDMIFCACGCKESIPKYNIYGKIRKYIKGHGKRGKSKYDKTIMVLCACGCGKSISK